MVLKLQLQLQFNKILLIIKFILFKVDLHNNSKKKSNETKNISGGLDRISGDI